MENDFWLKKWQSSDIAFHQEDVNPDLITYFKKLNLNRGDRVFVPLCGKSRDMLWLANQGYHVIGIDLSPIACSDFFSELQVSPSITKEVAFTKYQHNNIELICGDFFSLTAEHLSSIRAIYDCKALIALPQEQHKKYVDHIVTCVGHNVKILLIAIESPNEVKGPPFPVDSFEINALYGSTFNIQKVKHVCLNDPPENLIRKGYKEMTETAYLISN